MNRMRMNKMNVLLPVENWKALYQKRGIQFNIIQSNLRESYKAKLKWR